MAVLDRWQPSICRPQRPECPISRPFAVGSTGVGAEMNECLKLGVRTGGLNVRFWVFGAADLLANPRFDTGKAECRDCRLQTSQPDFGFAPLGGV